MSHINQDTPLTDRRGLALSTGDEAAAHYREGTDRLLELAPGAVERLEAALAADPCFLVAHAALALAHLVEDRPSRARAAVLGARASLAGAPDRGDADARERRHFEIIAAGATGDGPRALELAREHAREAPRDVLVLTLLCALALRGDVKLKLEVERLLHQVAPACRDDWAFLSLEAAHLDDLGRHDEALASALRALALHPAGARAAHVLAHVRYERGEHAQGRRFLAWWLALWTPAPHVLAHLRWHEGLFALALAERGAALSRWSTWISPAVSIEAPGALEGGASLLWRLSLDDPDAPLDWGALRREAMAAARGTGSPLTDLHVALVLAGAGEIEALDRLVTALEDQRRRGDTAAAGAALPIVIGLRAFATGDPLAAAAHLEPALPGLSSLRGERAQNEVFEDTLIEALLRGGRADAAERRLQARLLRRPSHRDLGLLERALLAQRVTAPSRPRRDDRMPDTEPSPSSRCPSTLRPASARGPASSVGSRALGVAPPSA